MPTSPRFSIRFVTAPCHTPYTNFILKANHSSPHISRLSSENGLPDYLRLWNQIRNRQNKAAVRQWWGWLKQGFLCTYMYLLNRVLSVVKLGKSEKKFQRPFLPTCSCRSWLEILCWRRWRCAGRNVISKKKVHTKNIIGNSPSRAKECRSLTSLGGRIDGESISEE